tara:strand:- start:130705 stop:132915 length:2211 start_codon:yes stop_codon:yes gene_type:complete
MKYYNSFLLPALLSMSIGIVYGQYRDQSHSVLPENAVAVDKPGYYGSPGTHYMLTQDISSDRSAIFLGKDVILDLNGYTITYAEGDYEHIPNYSFEEGLKGWDTSLAPGAKIENARQVHEFIGDSILRLQKGDVIRSDYINLPVANRSYYAMCGVTGRFYREMKDYNNKNMRVSVFVEDEAGNEVRCLTNYGDTTMLSCPVENRTVRLGGGFVVAHINNLPAGKYRIKIRADNDCLVDHIDLRPAMDVGVGIVEKTHPKGHTDHLFERNHSAFFDYTADAIKGKPVEGIPIVKGKGTVTIKNGTIKNGTRGVLSWGVQSTANNTHLILDNVKFESSGINTTAVDVPQAVITNCLIDIDNPFLINRHGSEFYAVDLRGEQASEVSNTEIYGGQGCLVFKGKFSKIHNNLFVNRQMVTNHYSIMAMGDSSLIFNNTIKPETGSGIEVYVRRGMEIFDNEIWTEPSPPTCEYGHEEFSTAAIRLADYNAKPGSLTRGCFGNKVYNNKIYVTGRDYPEYPDYIPMAWAVFYSASGGDNYIFGNDIYVEDKTIGEKNETAAFYIGGGTIGGHFYNNRITTNVPAAWVASRYGSARETKIYNNRIIRSNATNDAFKPFRVGWSESSIATDIEFRSNTFINTKMGYELTDSNHSYSVYWTLKLLLVDKKGNSVEDQEVKIFDAGDNEVRVLRSDDQGMMIVELPAYRMEGQQKTLWTPYSVIVGKKSEIIALNQNTELTMVLR